MIKRCCEEQERGWEREPEWEPEWRSESLMRTGDRNRSCNQEIGIADAHEDGSGDRIEGHKAGNEEELEAEGNTCTGRR